MNIKRLLITVALAALTSALCQAQGVAVKTNLLYDATTTLNLGVEIPVAYKWSIDIPVAYNPFTFDNNRKMKFWLVQPEARWWFCRPLKGQFLGVHLHWARYNVGGMLPWGFKSGKMFGSVSNDQILNNRFQGWLVGAGLSYGYAWRLGGRWSMEAEIGVGYAYIKYDKYECPTCGEYKGSGHTNYVGPTKAALNLIYTIK